MHNEYYGHGYGVFLNYYNSIIHSKPFFSPHYAMSFDYNDALKLNSISYFPSKVLEIVNLYDNIVFNNNKVLDSDEALSFIRENYLECIEIMEGYIENYGEEGTMKKLGEIILGGQP